MKNIPAILITLFCLGNSIIAETINLIPTDDLAIGDANTASYSPAINQPDLDSFTISNYTC